MRTRTALSRPRWVAGLLALATAAAVLLAPAPAHAAGSTVSGTVTGVGGAPLGSIYVYAYVDPAGDGSWAPAAFASTSSTGAFVLPDLPADTYRLSFSDPAKTYATEFYDDAASIFEADDVVVDGTTAVPQRNAQLALSPKVRGTVTGTAGQPLAGVHVDAYSQSSGGFWDVTASTTTAANGSYELAGLQAGTYRLGYEDPTGVLFPEFWDDARAVDEADDIALVAGQVRSGVDAVLGTAARISGTVTLPSGLSSGEVYVQVHRLDERDGVWELAAVTTTDTGGAYSVGGLAAGSYRLLFQPSDATVAQEWWDDERMLETADTIVVGSGQVVTGRDATLARAARILGRTVRLNGLVDVAVGDVEVTAYAQDGGGAWRPVSSTFSEANGNYALTQLPAGSYRLGFRDWSGAGLAREYWTSTIGSNVADVGGGETITLAANGQRLGTNVRLVPGGAVAGDVTDDEGDQTDADVVLYRSVDAAWTQVVRESTFGGSYEIDGLPAGAYRIGFEPHDPGLAPEFHDDRTTLATATTVNVAAGGTATITTAELADASVPPAITNTAPPAITGTARVGQVLTATPGTWDPADVTLAYRWLKGGDEIAGATSATYTPGPADVGAQLAVRVTATKTGHTAATAFSAATAPVAAATITNTSSPVVSGTAAVGSSVTASAGTWTPADVTTAFQWLVGGTEVAGATGASYTPVPADAGKQLAVRVTATKPAHTTATATSAAVEVAPGTITSTAPPVVSGTAKVGSTLTATAGAWTPAGVTTAFQWLVGGAEVAGATGASYTPVPGDAGKQVAVRVTATRAGYAPASATSAAATVAPGTIEAVSAPVVTGSGRVGEPLTATPGGWTPADVTTTYEWLVAGAPVAGATSATFTPRPGDVTQQVSARVTASRAGYADATATSAAVTVTPGSIANTATPVVSGSPVVGQQLSATAGTWSPADVTTTFQWLSGGAEVAGATGPTYTLTDADVGRSVAVRVTATRAGYTSSSVTSASRGPVTDVEIPAVSNVTAPTVTGTSQVGVALTATPGTWDPADAATAYQWLVRGVEVAGATGASYTPVPADVGGTVTVRVRATKDGHTPATVDSAPTAAVAPGTIAVDTEPTVTGTAAVGQPVTATAGTWTPAEVTTSFQWRVDGVDVPGATGPSYTPGPGDVGEPLAVRVTAARAGYAPESVTVAAGTVAPGTITNTSPPAVTGTPAVGSALTVTTGTWQPGDVATAFQWLVDGQPVEGATGATYTPAAGDVGKDVSVRVTASRAGYTAAVVTTAAVGPVVPVLVPVQNTARPTIAGTPRVGVRLTATAGTWSPADVTTAFQWLANGAPIAGATAATYVPGAAQVGRRLSVRVTATRAGRLPATETSLETAAVQPAATPRAIRNVAKPRITGKPWVGRTLKVTRGSWDPKLVTVRYQWYANGKLLTGATKAKLVLKAKHQGKRIKVVVTATRTGYATGRATSRPTGKVKAAKPGQRGRSAVTPRWAW
ncbi:carboxypeptidase regulatory-like domain-containing protein [Nocardioides sp. SYSU D00038]|uniref:carboxypeptidase regulatory-like domain-containing protein n=1 Tax=Nocardioides sp. SYSU D00038 TaxID=2812554 RepID=UPI001967E755|nr:carboxypeptidase regulatory-like domain-containing protein [Nocardioides sp. SYSU D00038]